MKTPELPAPDARSGVKIDYVTKRLALALAPLGFERRARQFTRAAGSGDEAHWQIVHVQADKWNEGPRGAFFVNLAVQFPALMRLSARRPGLEWLERHFDEVDESLGQVRERLGHLQSGLPATHPCARPAHSDEFKFGRGCDLGALAEAWVAEHQAMWRSNPAPLADLPSGRDVADLDTAGREAVLCALLQHLASRESHHAGLSDPLDPPVDGFDLDDSVKALLAALLPTLPAATELTVLTVLGHMRALVGRWQPELVTGGYPWGFALLVRWLAGPAGAPHRAAMQPAIAAWLESYSAFAVAAYERMAAKLAADVAAAEDPAHPLHDVLQEAREREADLVSRQPPPGAAEVRRRITEYPEQRMAGADKQAVATLRRELRRDAATGRLPVAWDADDWGQAAQSAWQALPASTREAVTPTLQGWLEGVDARPTKTWLRTLQAQVSCLAAPHAAVWQAWVLQQLAAFERSSGHTEWATTGARPGVGARLGEASENLLLGLLWWAWHDPALEAGILEPVLQRAATGAWQRLPEVGARAAVVGGLVLRMIAGLGDAARQRTAALAGARGTPKQLKQAVERALKEPLSR